MERSRTGKRVISGAERKKRYIARLRKRGRRKEMARILELIEENLALRQQLLDAVARLPSTPRSKRMRRPVRDKDEINRLRRQLAHTRRILREGIHAPKRFMQIKGFEV